MPISAARLFLYFALPFGLLFAFLTPPFGGGDEQHHFQRSYEIVTGYWLGHSEGPAGIRQLQDAGMQALAAGLRDRHYTKSSYLALYDIPLEPEHPVQQLENPLFAGQFPLAHLLYAPPMALGIALEMKPLHILYLCRITGMLLATLLTYAAIRITPVGANILCALALLPTSVFYRSFIHTDGLMCGLIFLYFALLSRALVHRHDADYVYTPRRFVPLALFGALIAPLKTGYCLVLFLSLLIPRGRFAKPAQYWLTQAMLILPGLLITAAWLLVITSQVYHDIRYDTTAGSNVSPSAQLHFMMLHPFTYLSQLGAYVFSLHSAGVWVLGLLGELGWMSIYLNAPVYFLLMIGLALVVKSEPMRLAKPLEKWQKLLVPGIFILTALFLMTLIHLHFNVVGSGAFVSFQGRYFLPILPLFIWLLPHKSGINPGIARPALTGLAALGLCAGAYTLAATYYWH